MVHWLTEELVKRGHEVTLFASGDSKTGGRLRPVCDLNLMKTMARGEAYEYGHYANASFAMAVQQSDTFDVIHCHLGAAMIPLASFSKCPVVHTVHAGLVVDGQWLLDRYPEVLLAAISRSQIAGLSLRHRRNIQVIYHGCDFDAYEPSLSPGKYLAFLGRMGPHKNPLDAIRIAKALGLPILLAGKPQERNEQIYFDLNIKPLIDGKNVIYVGSVSFSEKNDLLKNASALLFPIQWEEHFGLVMIEAMACGTPVIACNRGSVSEVVDFGKTGFYGDSVDDLVSLVPRALSLDRRAVREHALKRFSIERMVDEYVQLYAYLVAPVR